MAEMIGSKFCVLLLYDVYKEKMFRIEKEDGCEAPWKPTSSMHIIQLQILISLEEYD